MNNLKKTAMGLMVGAMAIGFSAFTSAKKLASVTYYQTSLNNYEKMSSPSGDCDLTQPTKNTCEITYASDPGVSSFSYINRPSGGSELATKAIYVP